MITKERIGYVSETDVISAWFAAKLIPDYVDTVTVDGDAVVFVKDGEELARFRPTFTNPLAVNINATNTLSTEHSTSPSTTTALYGFSCKSAVAVRYIHGENSNYPFGGGFAFTKDNTGETVIVTSQSYNSVKNTELATAYAVRRDTNIGATAPKPYTFTARQSSATVMRPFQIYTHDGSIVYTPDAFLCETYQHADICKISASGTDYLSFGVWAFRDAETQTGGGASAEEIEAIRSDMQKMETSLRETIADFSTNQALLRAELNDLKENGGAGTPGKDGADGYTPQKGVDYWTEEDKEEIISELSAENPLPDYWEDYLPEKIEQIKNLQKQGGKDCFSFVAIADIHYPSNLGKRSPKIAEKIMNEANIKYAIVLGDTQTRGCRPTEADLIAENENLKEMLSPIARRMLRTRGNHDLNWGKLDRDGNGTYNNDVDGVVKPPEEKETYVYSMTDGEVYEELFRPVGIVGNANFDESGTGYWIDDIPNKVRYIVLNTQNSKYELQADGTQKYPPMWAFRFQQSQFDMTINALNTVPTDEWGVVVCGHCPLWQEIGDREIMTGVLSAYKNKTTYTGIYEGTASGGAAYTNHAEPIPDNTTDTTKWIDGYRYGSSGAPSAETGTTVSNMIAISDSCTIRIKGAVLRDGKDRIVLFVDDANLRGYFNNGITNSAGSVNYVGLVDDVYTFQVAKGEGALSGFRFAMATPEDASNVIVTVDEEIAEAEHGYDYVSVDADFSESKGTLVGYFAGHTHSDSNSNQGSFDCITTRCDAREENTDELKNERIVGTVTEQSFDVFTVNKKTRKIYATKIGAGIDREISY